MLKKSAALLAAMSLAAAPVALPTSAVAQQTIEEDGQQSPSPLLAVALIVTITVIIFLATGELDDDDQPGVSP